MPPSRFQTPRFQWIVLLFLLLVVSGVNFWRAVHIDPVEIDVPLRIMTAISWLESPHWPGTEFWLPLHRMLLGVWLGILPETPTFDTVAKGLLFGQACYVLLVLFASLLAYRLEKTWWWITPLGLLLGPLYWEQSLIPLAELPATVFLVCSLWLIHKATEPQKNARWLLFATILILCAEMLRYELWAVVPFIVLAMPKSRWKFYFLILLAVFPLMWMFGHWTVHHDPLYGIHKAATWQQAKGFEAINGFQEGASRTAFWLNTVGFGAGLPVVLLGIIGLFSWKTSRWKTWTAGLAVFLLAVNLFGLLSGTSLPRSRYFLPGLTLLVVFAPLGLGILQNRLSNLSRRLQLLVLAVIVVSMLVSPMAFFASSHRYVPENRPSYSDTLANSIDTLDSNLPVSIVSAQNAFQYLLALKLEGNPLDRIAILATFPDRSQLKTLLQEKPAGFLITTAPLSSQEQSLLPNLKRMSFPDDNNLFLFRYGIP